MVGIGFDIETVAGPEPLFDPVDHDVEFAVFSQQVLRPCDEDRLVQELRDAIGGPRIMYSTSWPGAPSRALPGWHR